MADPQSKEPTRLQLLACAFRWHLWSQWEYTGGRMTVSSDFGGKSYGPCQRKICRVCGKAKARIG